MRTLMFPQQRIADTQLLGITSFLLKKIISCNISSLGLLQDPLFAPHFLSSPRFSVSIKVQKCYEQVNGLIGAGSYIQFKDAVKLIKIKDHKKWRLFISW